MIAGADRPTLVERAGQPDCLVALTREWLRQPLARLCEAERGRQIQIVCLWIAQMRHVPVAALDLERAAWLDRVLARLCAEVPELKPYAAGARYELERCCTSELVRFHDWRERIAPVVAQPSEGASPTDGSEVSA